MWFTQWFHTWKHSIRRFLLDSLHWGFGGTITSGFKEFPQLEPFNSRIPPRFLALKTLGKHHRWFPRVSTQVNSKLEDSTYIPGKLMETYLTAVSSDVSMMFSSCQFHKYFYFKCNENDKLTLKYFNVFT